MNNIIVHLVQYNKLIYRNKGQLAHCIISLCSRLEINCYTDSTVHTLVPIE